MQKTDKKHTSGWKVFLWNLLAMFIVGVLVIVGVSFLLDAYTKHGQEVEMPDLRGLKVEQAIERLHALGLEADTSDSIHTKSFPVNTIAMQSVSSGTHVKVGRTIRITINSTHSPMVALPDLADNSSVREAQIRLTSLGIKRVTIESTEGERDWVYNVKVNGRSVSPGTKISSDSRITLLVGNGFNNDELDEELDFIDDSDSTSMDGSTSPEFEEVL